MFGCRGKVLAVVCRVFRLDLRLVYCLPCLVSQEVSISLPVLALYKYISIHMLFLLEEKTVFLVKKEFQCQHYLRKHLGKLEDYAAWMHLYPCCIIF